MNERELSLFSSLSGIGDDLVLESAAFLPALGAAAGGAAAPDPSAVPAAAGGKRPPWFLPATIAACAAVVAVIGILVGVVGDSFGFFPYKPPETTVEEMTDEPTEEPSEKSETEGYTDDPVTEAPTDPLPDYHVEQNDYGLPFTILYCSDSFENGYYFDNTDASPSYALGEAAYQRILQAEQYLGVEITAKDGGDQNAYYSAFIASAGAGRDEYQLILTHTSRGLVSMMISSYLADLREQERLMLSADYWSPTQNERLTVSGKQFIAYSDFLLPDGYVLGFNRELVNDKFTDTDLYQLVEEQGWTLEKMQTYVTAYNDDNGDGKWDEEDSYGLSCYAWTPLIAFTTSSDIRVLDQTDQRITLSAMDDKSRAAAVDNFLYALMGLSSTYSYTPSDGGQPLRLQSGRVMFEPVTLTDLIRYGDENTDVGILPYPLYDRAQEDYRTLYMGGYMAVPHTVQHEDMAGDVIETLVYQSRSVRAAYLETVLTCGNCTSTHDRDMLERVEASMTVEQGLTLMDVHPRMEALMYAIPRHIMGESAYETNVPFLWTTASQKLDDFVRTVEALSES